MIKIVTDSTACLTQKDAEQMDIHVVPVGFSVGNKSFYEGFSDENEDYSRTFNSENQCATFQPSPLDFSGVFEDELTKGNEVLCVTLSSRLSGAYNSAQMAAKGQEGRVLVLDSRLTAGGLQLLIEEAHRIKDEVTSISEMATRLEEIRNRISLFFSVGDMSPLRKSGRLGFVRMSVGTILNIRPILTCNDGVIMSELSVRGEKEVIRNLADKVGEKAVEAIVNYMENSHIACSLYNVIRLKYPQLKIRMRKIGPVLGIHLGRDAVGISAITK